MTVHFIDLGAASGSLEFEPSELPAVRDALAHLFGPIVEAAGVDVLIWNTGEDQLFVTSDWDGVSLVAIASTGVAKLRQLETAMQADAAVQLLAR